MCIDLHKRMVERRIFDKLNKVKDEEDNAGCPVCKETWMFDDEEAWWDMTIRQRTQLLDEGIVLVVCGRCDNKEWTYEMIQALREAGVRFTHEELDQY